MEFSQLHDRNETLLNKDACTEEGIKLYKARWIVITSYIIYAAINAYQWFEYSIITNIIMKYYNVDAVAVNWTSVIYMILYMPMVIPASFLIDKKVISYLLCFIRNLSKCLHVVQDKANSTRIFS